MKRTYQQDWTEIFGDRDDTRSSDQEEFTYDEPTMINPDEDH